MSFRKMLDKVMDTVAQDLGRFKFMQRVFDRFDRETEMRRQETESTFASVSKITVAVLIAGSILWFFTARIGYYTTWLRDAANQPGVVNLTGEKVNWDVFYGQSETCGEVDCHVTPDYPKDKFAKQMVLPAREFPLRDYKQGQIVYLRTKLQVPKNVWDSSEALAFHSLYVWAENYKMYVNGNLIAEGGRETINVSLPRDFFGDDRTIAISFRIDPGELPYQGIAHKGYLLLGDKKALEGVAFSSREVKTIYYLWFLIPTAIITLVFSVLFLTVYRHNDTFHFILFGIFSCVSILVKTEYMPGILRGVELHHLDFGWNFLAQVALLCFVHDFFRRKSSFFSWLVNVLYAASISFMLGTLLSDSFRELSLSEAGLFKLNDFADGAVSCYTLVLSSATAIYLAKKKFSKFRFVASISMFCLSLVASTMIVMKYAGVKTTNSSDLVWMVFDTGYFAIVGIIVAVELGVALSQKKILNYQLGQFVDPDIAKALLADPDILKPKTTDITILFSDIRSFTSLTEKTTAEEVFSFLEEYRDAVLKIVSKYNGYVDKCEGDSVMAVWGAPRKDIDHSFSAVAAAVEMRKVVGDLNLKRRERGEFEFQIGIGIASGVALAGTLTTDTKTEYTVIGDTVNLASRLESLTKNIKADILVNETTFASIKTRVVAESVGARAIKGKENNICVYKILGIEIEGRLVCNDDRYYSQNYDLPSLVQNSPDNLFPMDYSNLKQKSQPKQAG